MSDLTLPAGPLAPCLPAVETFVQRAKAPNTLKAYQADWRRFTEFCRGRELNPLPATPETVAAYASDAAGTLRARTIERHLTSIARAHDLARHPNPCADPVVRMVMSGVRRVKGTAQQGKDPLSPALLRQMLAHAHDGVRGLRDRALLLVGFAGALRRSELVALCYEDVAFTDEGMVLTLRRSKTDQAGEGYQIGIPRGRREETCPVRALRDWLDQAGISAGPLFPRLARWGGEVTARPLGAHQVARIVKRLAEGAGLDPAALSAHSLRSGLCTSAAEGGASERSIMDQSRHKSLKILRKYIRRGSLFRDNAAAHSGL